jgi:catechol 2,3-dioxygenase-like lactoylglutathione lyase family enzyme
MFRVIFACVHDAGRSQMARALAFYRDLLGFAVVSASPEVETAEGRFSHWMWLRFGGAEIMLNTRYDTRMSARYSLNRRGSRMPCFTSVALM